MHIKALFKIDIHIIMVDILNNSIHNINNLLENNNLGTLPLSVSQNISYYTSSPKNEQEPDDQEYQSNQNGEGETPKLNIKLKQNLIGAENKEKGNDNEIPGNTVETKNTSNEINFSGIEKVPDIQNIVSTADLNCKLNLKEIALQANNVKYDPKKFSGLIMKIKEPKATALIFPNGKIVCLGAKNEEQSKNACRKFGKIIKKFGFSVTLGNFKIQNIVGSCKLNFKLPLIALYHHIIKKMNSKVAYEPELFPGLIYHYLAPKINSDNGNEKNPNIVFLIFNSGNIVIAGAKNRNQIYEAFSKVYPLLYKFKQPLK